ncbi:MAG TPA: oxaloacetate decarboxylase [Methylomirabilota bacterium]|jgi:2-methylisocitrate lyase-like PEP mutase family enzyme|nr:oxaloacetate decarboxylase [Methylomirabilota bacterium]
MKSTTKLRQLLERPGMLVAPGAHDVMSARLVEAEGFEAVYLGGFAASASSLGLPDHSLITMTELLDHARRVAAAVQIPILADIDDGGGTPLSVQRTIRLAEQAGVAAVHVEDLIAGKHFVGHKDRLFSKDQAVDKVKAAVDARTDADFVVIARSDAIGVTSLDDALERAQAYAEAGADLVFLPYLRLKDIPKAVAAVPKPLFNVVIDTSQEEVARAGLKVAVYPVQSLFVAYKAIRDMMKELKATGTIANWAQRTPTWNEFNEFIGAVEATKLAERYRIV